MAITDVRQLRKLQISESKSDKGTVQLTGSQEFLVICDTANPAFTDIARDETSWPKIGGPLPQIDDEASFSGYTLNVTSRKFDYYDEENEFAVRVVVQYDAKDENTESQQPQGGESSTWLNMSIQSVSATQPATGWGSRGSVPPENSDNQGSPAKNSAYDPVDGLTEDVSMVKLVYTNARVTNPDFEKLLFYVNRCNDGSWGGAEDYTVKVAGYSADFDQKNNVWSISVEFLYNPKGWQIKYYDAGFHEIVGGERQAILDKSGNPVSKPVPLNGAGQAKDAGEEPLELELFPYPIADISNMFSACRI